MPAAHASPAKEDHTDQAASNTSAAEHEECVAKAAQALARAAIELTSPSKNATNKTVLSVAEATKVDGPTASSVTASTGAAAGEACAAGKELVSGATDSAIVGSQQLAATAGETFVTAQSSPGSAEAAASNDPETAANPAAVPDAAQEVAVAATAQALPASAEAAASIVPDTVAAPAAVPDAAQKVVKETLADPAAVPDAAQEEVKETLADPAAVPDAAQEEVKETVADPAAVPDAAQEEVKETLADPAAVPDAAQEEEVEEILADPAAVSDAAQEEVKGTVADPAAVPDAAQEKVKETVADPAAVSDAAQEDSEPESAIGGLAANVLNDCFPTRLSAPAPC